MKKTVRTNKGGWFSVAITLILFGGMFLFANKENIKSAFTGAYDIYDEDVNASDIKIGDGIRTDIYMQHLTILELLRQPQRVQRQEM